MENLADKLRKENANKFEQIKQELTEKVISDIQKYGDGCVYLSTSISGDKVGERKGANEGFEINKDYRIAVKEHFKNLGFVVIDCVSPGGRLFGYMVEL